MTSIVDCNLWADTVCRTHVNLRTDRIVSGHPATTVTLRPSWLDNVECVARYHIGRLDCGEWVNVEGVLVERTSAHARLNYKVAGSVYSFEAAVKIVCEMTSDTK